MNARTGSTGRDEIRPRRGQRRLLYASAAAFVVAGVSATFAATAFANSATPTNQPTPTGAIVVNGTGSAAVSVSGTWSWPFSSLGATSVHPCDHRIGVGWAIIWNDPNDSGTALSTSGVTVHVGSTGVDPVNTDQKVTYNASDPCGTFTETNSPNPGDGNVAGNWTGTHTYPNVADVPAEICIVTYDLGPGKSPAPNRLKLSYDDNSFTHSFDNGGTWNSTAGGSNCTATTTFKTTGAMKVTPTLATQATGANVGSPITDTATLAGTSSGHAGGAVTFDAYGPSDTHCSLAAVFSEQVPVTGNSTYGPVSFVATGGAGTYRWIASYNGDSGNNSVSGVCGDATELSVVTSPATSPSTSPPAGTPPPPAPIPGVTTVHTGEPWAGDGRILAVSSSAGMSLLLLGLYRRRRFS
jgi:hypothetical protein